MTGFVFMNLMMALMLSSMGLIALHLVLLEVDKWVASGKAVQREYEYAKSVKPLIERRTRFKEYVEGERRLMQDWEEAFDPGMHAVNELRKQYPYLHWVEKTPGKQILVPGGGQAGPMPNPPASPFAGPMFDNYFDTPRQLGGMTWQAQQYHSENSGEVDRDQCKLEADSLLQRRYITTQEYGDQIKNCNEYHA